MLQAPSSCPTEDLISVPALTLALLLPARGAVTPTRPSQTRSQGAIPGVRGRATLTVPQFLGHGSIPDLWEGQGLECDGTMGWTLLSRALGILGRETGKVHIALMADG